MTDFGDEAPFYVGVDVGGTNIKVGVVSNFGNSLSYVRVPTEAEKGPQQGLDSIETAIRRAVEESGLTLAEQQAVEIAPPTCCVGESGVTRSG